jgi:hypothetical protein
MGVYGVLRPCSGNLWINDPEVYHVLIGPVVVTRVCHCPWFMGPGTTLIKKKTNFPHIQYKKIQMGSGAKSMRKGFLIQCANISSYMRRPLVIQYITVPRPDHSEFPDI